MTPPGRAALEVRVAVSRDDLEAHHRVRHRVFVDEQAIFAGTDRDARDAGAVLVVAALGPLVVGAVRVYPLDDEGLWKGDRLAVLHEARRLRVGAPLVRFAVATAGTRGGARMIAQIQERNVAFFQHLGWERIGDLAGYHGRTHQEMEIVLAGARADRVARPAT